MPEPRGVEQEEKRRIEFEAPKYQREIHLPGALCSGRRLKTGMHEDMFMSLQHVLAKLKPETSGKLLIQARLLTEEQARKLTWNRIQRFFEAGRYRRTFGESEVDKEVREIILPKDLNVSSKEEAVRLAQVRYTAESLSETDPADLGEMRVGHKVAWFPAKMLMEHMFHQSSELPRGAYGALVGVNEFKIGSNELSLGLLSLIERRIEAAFEKDQFLVIKKSGPDWVKEKAMLAVAKIIKL